MRRDLTLERVVEGHGGLQRCSQDGPTAPKRQLTWTGIATPIRDPSASPLNAFFLTRYFLPLRRILSFLCYRTAPTRQVIGIYSLCQLKRFLDRMIEISLHSLALHASP